MERSPEGSYDLDRIAFLALILTVVLHLLVSQQRLDLIRPVTWPMAGLVLLAFLSLLNEPYEPQDWSMFVAKWLVPFTLYQISARIFDHPAALRRFEIFSLVVLADLFFPGYIVDENVGIHADRARGPFLQAVANGMTINMLALVALDSFPAAEIARSARDVFLLCRSYCGARHENACRVAGIRGIGHRVDVLLK